MKYFKIIFSVLLLIALGTGVYVYYKVNEYEYTQPGMRVNRYSGEIQIENGKGGWMRYE